MDILAAMSTASFIASPDLAADVAYQVVPAVETASRLSGEFLTIVSLIIGAYLAIISHMVYTSVQLGRIYQVVNGHIQNDDPHLSAGVHFVTSEVCQAIQSKVQSDLGHIKEGIGRIEGQNSQIIAKMIGD